MKNESLSYYEAVLADLEREREQLDSTRAQLNLLIEGMRARISRLGGLSVAEVKEAAQPQTNSAKPFAGVVIYEAARKYLETVKGPRTVRQIWEALKEGGLPDIHHNAVYTALYRRQTPHGEFARVTEKLWGLAEWNLHGGGQPYTLVSNVALSEVPQAKTGKPTQIDLCESFLREAGRPLHINTLVAKLGERGIKTNRDSLSGNIRKEKLRRFKNVGHNTFGLAEWPASVLSIQGERALPL